MLKRHTGQKKLVEGRGWTTDRRQMTTDEKSNFLKATPHRRNKNSKFEIFREQQRRGERIRV